MNSDLSTNKANSGQVFGSQFDAHKMSVLLRTDDLKLEKQEHGLKFKTAFAIISIWTQWFNLNI